MTGDEYLGLPGCGLLSNYFSHVLLQGSLDRCEQWCNAGFMATEEATGWPLSLASRFPTTMQASIISY